MKTHVLQLSNYHSTGEFIRFFDENDLQKGDTLKVTTAESEEIILVAVVLMIVWAMVFSDKQKRNRQKDGERILESIFKSNTTIEEIEKQVKEEYGVNLVVELQPDEESSFWNKVSAHSLSKLYSSDEADYSDVTVLEPNPSYRPCKPGK
jgi:hypothetical protein